MAIKKAKFPASSLPAIDAKTNGYLVRFRVVSDDRNRKSAWSPIYVVEANYDYGIGNAGKSVSGNIMSLAWDKVSVMNDGDLVRYINAYDIWISYDGETFTYHSSTTETSSNIILTTPGTTPTVKIYHKTNPPTEIESLLLYVI
jgi:hypothetical protein